MGVCEENSHRGTMTGMMSAAANGTAAMNGGLWLSILVPVYNVRPFVEECLSSILYEMRDDAQVELIVLDDCSTDGSAELCRQMARAVGGRAHVISHARNRGISAARNTLVDAARGRYIWFIDADDRMVAGAIDALRAIVNIHQPDLISCDYVREGDVPFSTYDGPAHMLSDCTETLIAGIFARRRLHVWSRVWKRDLFSPAMRFPDGACFEDVAIVPRLLLQVRSFFHVPEPWIYYRSRPGSIMAQLARTAKAFDRRRNDELARALVGFHAELPHCLPGVSARTKMVIARFLEREYVKISKRLLRCPRSRASIAQLRREIGRYRGVMEGCSPVPFGQVAWQYLRNGKVVRAGGLWLALAMSRRPGKL